MLASTTLELWGTDLRLWSGNNSESLAAHCEKVNSCVQKVTSRSAGGADPAAHRRVAGNSLHPATSDLDQKRGQTGQILNGHPQSAVGGRCEAGRSARNPPDFRTIIVCALPRHVGSSGGNPDRRRFVPAGSTWGGSGGNEWTEALQEKAPLGSQQAVQAQNS